MAFIWLTMDKNLIRGEYRKFKRLESYVRITLGGFVEDQVPKQILTFIWKLCHNSLSTK